MFDDLEPFHYSPAYREAVAHEEYARAIHLAKKAGITDDLIDEIPEYKSVYQICESYRMGIILNTVEPEDFEELMGAYARFIDVIRVKTRIASRSEVFDREKYINAETGTKTKQSL